jgi:hypothetical protein
MYAQFAVRREDMAVIEGLVVALLSDPQVEVLYIYMCVYV